MVVVTAIWGSISILAILSKLPSPVFVFFRVFISATVLAIAIRSIRLEVFRNRYVLLSGLFLALNWILLFYAVAMLQIGRASCRERV